ncbi:uncharacterized protein [Dysidea avara]|uniref:uncharacterized protein n=1 Tax=Dysidea avara TaxID=196820 RepID=UPI003329AA94
MDTVMIIIGIIVSSPLILLVTSYSGFQNPQVALTCSSGPTNNIVNVTWSPVHEDHDSVEDILKQEKLQWCKIKINCRNGQNKVNMLKCAAHNFNPVYEWTSVPASENFCSVTVLYRDFYDSDRTVFHTMKECYFRSNSTVTKMSPTSTLADIDVSTFLQISSTLTMDRICNSTLLELSPTSTIYTDVSTILPTMDIQYNATKTPTDSSPTILSPTLVPIPSDTVVITSNVMDHSTSTVTIMTVTSTPTSSTSVSSAGNILTLAGFLLSTSLIAASIISVTTMAGAIIYCSLVLAKSKRNAKF